MSASLNAIRRSADLAELAAGREVDLVVIGGGFTGVGVALDAASRGLSVALLERRDLANGTSRFSSKLAHGGLRYLAKGQVMIAWESARERAALLNNSHLVRPLPMVLPLGPYASRSAGFLAAQGFRAGNVLRIMSGTSRKVLPGPRRISAAKTTTIAPAVSTAGLRGGLLSWDGQLEDDARLVVQIARTAAVRGARIITYASVTQVRRDGVTAVDERTGEVFNVRAKHVVSATGVWADTLAAGVTLRPSKGAHLLVAAARLGNPRAAITVPVPGQFGRYVFAVPWPDGLVMIGLTDDTFDGEIPDEPQPDAADETFLLDTINQALETPLTPADVLGRFAGLRPLLEGVAGSTADLTRKHAIIEDPLTSMMTIVGGKLTTYRQMAEDVVDRLTTQKCRTRRLPLVGHGPVDPGVPARLARRFGSEATHVAAAGDTEPISAEIPVTRAEIRFAVDHELALTASDVLDRRTRVGLIPAWRDRMLAAIREVAPELFDGDTNA